jgi:hypothetical protein
MFVLGYKDNGRKLSQLLTQLHEVSEEIKLLIVRLGINRVRTANLKYRVHQWNCQGSHLTVINNCSMFYRMFVASNYATIRLTWKLANSLSSHKPNITENIRSSEFNLHKAQMRENSSYWPCTSMLRIFIIFLCLPCTFSGNVTCFSKIPYKVTKSYCLHSYCLVRSMRFDQEFVHHKNNLHRKE